ncbi:hypothetical protein KBZ21_46770, partial [Streptomyces sp. A73]|nr:hypothetical protein [Streptomyces sp. A73]
IALPMHEVNDRFKTDGASALAWSERQTAVLHEALRLLYPDGIHSPGIGPQDVRAVVASLIRGEQDA